MRNLIFHYLKDKNGKKTGQTLCIIVKEGNAFFGIATCAKEDNYNKKIGKWIAQERAEEAYKNWKTKQVDKDSNGILLNEKTVTISNIEYEQLLENQNLLRCLEGAGVDNWEGYDYALDIYRGEE